MTTQSDLLKTRRKFSGKLTRSKAIKLYCKEICSAGDLKSWKNCKFEDCFLYRFRTGRKDDSKEKSISKTSSILPNIEDLEVTCID